MAPAGLSPPILFLVIISQIFLLCVIVDWIQAKLLLIRNCCSPNISSTYAYCGISCSTSSIYRAMLSSTHRSYPAPVQYPWLLFSEKLTAENSIDSISISFWSEIHNQPCSLADHCAIFAYLSESNLKQMLCSLIMLIYDRRSHKVYTKVMRSS